MHTKMKMMKRITCDGWKIPSKPRPKRKEKDENTKMKNGIGTEIITVNH
jgi:hypothetical protein